MSMTPHCSHMIASIFFIPAMAHASIAWSNMALFRLFIASKQADMGRVLTDPPLFNLSYRCIIVFANLRYSIFFFRKPMSRHERPRKVNRWKPRGQLRSSCGYSFNRSIISIITCSSSKMYASCSRNALISLSAILREFPSSFASVSFSSSATPLNDVGLPSAFPIKFKWNCRLALRTMPKPLWFISAAVRSYAMSFAPNSEVSGKPASKWQKTPVIAAAKPMSGTPLDNALR
mmetsp:Transcript_1431/g.2658  ORF Transcript_1431/g.2658 Transcript_1431/m.2658 type:complete len:233 (+) Transcript_1431:300-998(+)